MPKGFIYTGIHVTDIERSISFYTNSFGMKLLFKTKIKETGGKVAWLRSPSTKQILELNWYPRGYKFGGKSGLDHLAFEVPNVEHSFTTITKKYRSAIPPFIEGRWKLAYVKDPDGNWIELGEILRTKRKGNKGRRRKEY